MTTDEVPFGWDINYVITLEDNQLGQILSLHFTFSRNDESLPAWFSQGGRVLMVISSAYGQVAPYGRIVRLEPQLGAKAIARFAASNPQGAPFKVRIDILDLDHGHGTICAFGLGNSQEDQE